MAATPALQNPDPVTHQTIHRPGVARQPVPALAGIGLRAPHVRRVLAERPSLGWFEVHSENLFAEGGEMHAAMDSLRADYPVSFHGVGMSLGSADVLDREHLARLVELVDYYQPGLVSEHLCWGGAGGMHSNDLLPLPMTQEALALMVSRIQQVQDTLGRELLVENISTYFRFKDADYSEWDFVAEVVRQSGCGLLLDINNIYVNSINHGFDPREYLCAMPREAVREIHLAGFTRKSDVGVALLIDSHSRPVDTAVWALYQEALGYLGPTPTLIEWDEDIPDLDILVAEASKAQEMIDGCNGFTAKNTG